MKETEYLILLILSIMIFIAIIFGGYDIADLQKKQENLNERILIIETKMEMVGI